MESQTISPSAAITAISWTGGKDCNFALLSAWRDPSLNVTCLVCFRFEGNRSPLAHPISFMEAQAASLQLPLLHVNIPKSNTTEEYKKAYVDGILKLRFEHNVTVIGTGDMDFVGTMERNWIEECCELASAELAASADHNNNDSNAIRVYLPLWKANRADLIQNLLDEQFDIIFSCVKSPYFDRTWVGRKLDKDTFDILKDMSSSLPQSSNDNNEDEQDDKDGDGEAHMPLDLGGERGEYHTMCLNGPLYTRPVDVTILDEPYERIMNVSEKSKKVWKGNIHFAQYLWSINIQEEKSDQEEKTNEESS